MRKRSIIAGIFTIVILLLTNHFWLNVNPVDVELELSNIENATIKVQLANKFNKSNIVKKDIDLYSKKSDLKLRVGNILTFDKIKIAVNSDVSGVGNSINALNTAIRGGKYEVNGCTTTVLPDDSTEYVCNVKGRASFKFEIEIFIIILILSYLMSYKLIDYLADFKSIKEKSRIEILFLSIFFVFLFLPMSNIDKSLISKSENRTLAKWQPLATGNGNINYNFGKNFDNWYNDRFFLRKDLLDVYNILRYYIAKNVYVNKNGIVNKNNNWISNSKAVDPWIITQEDKDRTVENINKLKTFSKDNNMKFYIIVVPRKEEICSKYFEPYMRFVSKYKQTTEIIDYVKQKTNVEIVYPYKELEAYQEKGMAYFKTDHHWTDDGAYLGYLKLMEQIKKDFPEVKVKSSSDYNYVRSNLVKTAPFFGFFKGRTYQVLKLKDPKILDTSYRYYKSKNISNITYHHDGYGEYHITDYDQHILAPNMVLFGDSYTLNLLSIIPSSFKHTTNVFSPFFSESSLLINNYKNFILEHKPKVFIVCVCDIKRLQYLFERGI